MLFKNTDVFYCKNFTDSGLWVVTGNMEKTTVFGGMLVYLAVLIPPAIMMIRSMNYVRMDIGDRKRMEFGWEKCKKR